MVSYEFGAEMTSDSCIKNHSMAAPSQESIDREIVAAACMVCSRCLAVSRPGIGYENQRVKKISSHILCEIHALLSHICIGNTHKYSLLAGFFPLDTPLRLQLQQVGFNKDPP
jgi:hypothetical protein